MGNSHCVCVCGGCKPYKVGQIFNWQTLNLRLPNSNSILMGGSQSRPSFHQATIKEELQGSNSPQCPQSTWILLWEGLGREDRPPHWPPTHSITIQQRTQHGCHAAGGRDPTLPRLPHYLGSNTSKHLLQGHPYATYENMVTG